MKTTNTTNKTSKSVLFYEDLLQQKEFSLQDWRKAKRKHPVRFWFRCQYVSIRELFVKIKFAFIRLRLGLIK
jgi:hypothetical protein